MDRCISRRRWISLSAAVISGLGFSGRGNAGPKSASGTGIFLPHASGHEGFYSNSYLFEGEHACLLIDAHLNKPEILDLLELVKQTGKPLEAVVVTHPHPDHFLGLQHLSPVFPRATIYSSAGTLHFVQDYARQWDGFANPLIALAEGRLGLAGKTFECLLPADAESVAPVVLYDPDAGILIAGDHVLNGQHHWLAEGRGLAWRNNLGEIRHRWAFQTVLPGHGLPGGPTIIEDTDAYIARFLGLQASGVDAVQAKRAMRDVYSDYVFMEALDASISANFRG